jgi:putative ABC transport system permease protein
MKPIEARLQPRLGMRRCFQLALSGMRYQMLRSMITVGTLALAVVFVVLMAGSAVLSRDVQQQALMQLAPQREAQRWLTRLRAAESERTVLDALERADADRLREYTTWLGSDERADKQVRDGITAARELAGVRQWFTNLPEAAEAALLIAGTVEGTLDRLAEDEQWLAFQQRCAQLGVGPPLGGWNRFGFFAREGWPALRRSVEVIRLAHAAAVGSLSQVWPADALLPPAQAARAAGFVFDEALWQRVQDAALSQRQRLMLTERLNEPAVRASVARVLDVEPTQVSISAVLEASADGSTARSVLAAIGGAPQADASTLDVEALQALGQQERRLTRAASALPADMSEAPGPIMPVASRVGLSTVGLSAEAMLLLLLSLLVCIVGITNAMLMSVTERFTQIATMKCLGALDGTVRGVFVIEALLLGIVGGSAGALIGLLLVMGRGLMQYGSLLMQTTGALRSVGTVGLLALLLGLLLAVLAAIGPAWAAARLAPMEAMRIE